MRLLPPKKSLLLLMLGLGFISSVKSETNDLLESFNQQTDIATKTGLNVKYVPGVVDILYGNELRQRGYQTVLDAIERLPGVQLHQTSISTVANFRGNLSDPLQADIQILINGVSLVSGNDSQPFIALEMPLSSVERIEIIKGPGSAIYGEYAINGVINIITVKDEQGGSLHIGEGSFDTHNYSLGQTFKQDDWQLAVNVLRRRSDGPEFYVTEDLLVNSSTPLQPQASHAPGKADTRVYFDAAVLQLKNSGTTLDMSYTESLKGDGYGFGEYLTDNDDIRDELETSALQLKQQLFNSDVQTLALIAGVQQYSFQRQLEIRPRGFVTLFPQQPTAFDPRTSVPLAPLADDVHVYQKTKIRRSYGKLQWVIKSFDKHRILLEAGYQRFSVDSVRHKTNFDAQRFLAASAVQFAINNNLAGLGMSFPVNANTLNNETVFFDGLRTFDNTDGIATFTVDEDFSRSVYSLIVQDEFQWTDKTRLTTGIRFDDYSSRSSATSPRIALLHEFAEHQIFKMQLAQAFRPPSLNQESTNKELKDEESTTFELSFHHQYKQWSFEHIAYYNRLKNKLAPGWVFDPNGINNLEINYRFRNNSERFRYYGLEHSIRYQLNSNWHFESHIAYQNGDGPKTQSSEQFIAPLSIDVNVSWAVNNYLHIFVEQRYLSGRDRRPDDKRRELGGQTYTNLSINIEPLGNDRLSFIVAVQNIFDKDLRSPSAWLTTTAFPDDFEVMPRQLNASLEYRW